MWINRNYWGFWASLFQIIKKKKKKTHPEPQKKFIQNKLKVRIFLFFHAISLSSLNNFFLNLKIPPGLSPLCTSCLVCWTRTHNPQHAEITRSPIQEPSMLYFSLILDLTFNWQQGAQNSTGIRSIHPQSWFSIVAFCVANWQGPQKNDTKPT